MAHSAKVIADSVSEAGARLITMEVTLPRIVLAEFNTHRVFSRNSASSRAIPIKEQIRRVMADPYIPIHWGVNRSGMQADAELTEDEVRAAKSVWLKARDNAVSSVDELMEIGLHKQVTNRLLEPFMWQTILVTSTEWSNFHALRANAQAHPEIRRAAELMRAAQGASTPKLLRLGEYHLPLIQPDELDWAANNIEMAIKVSVGRCARVSYLTHDGKRDHAKDIELYDRLVTSGHMSPLEHVATPLFNRYEWSGNFQGWRQFRKTIPNENDFSKIA